jgi:hypothetical protein
MTGNTKKQSIVLEDTTFIKEPDKNKSVRLNIACLSVKFANSTPSSRSHVNPLIIVAEDDCTINANSTCISGKYIVLQFETLDNSMGLSDVTHNVVERIASKVGVVEFVAYYSIVDNTRSISLALCFKQLVVISGITMFCYKGIEPGLYVYSSRSYALGKVLNECVAYHTSNISQLLSDNVLISNISLAQLEVFDKK